MTRKKFLRFFCVIWALPVGDLQIGMTCGDVKLGEKDERALLIKVAHFHCLFDPLAAGQQ
jgi:hypothetical protein